MKFQCFVMLMIGLMQTSEGRIDEETEEIPEAPQKLNCSAVVVATRSTHSITLNIPNSDGIKGYRAYSDKIPTSAITYKNDTEIILNGLQPGSAYNITIQAIGYGILPIKENCSYTALTCPPDICEYFDDMKNTPTSVMLNYPFLNGTLGYFARLTANDTFSKFKETPNEGTDVYYQGLEEGTEYNIEVLPFGQNNITCSRCFIDTNTRTWNPSCNNRSLVQSETEGKITLNLSSITYNGSKANVYVITVSSKGEPKEYTVDIHTVLYNITFNDPATNYTISIKMAVRDEFGEIDSVSQAGCSITYYTHPQDPICNRIEGNFNTAHSLQFLIDVEDEILAYYAKLPFTDFQRFEASLDGVIVFFYNLTAGTEYNVTLKSEGKNMVMSETECTLQIYTKTEDPVCNGTSFVKSVTETSLTVDLSRVIDKQSNADGYQISVLPTRIIPHISKITDMEYTVNGLKPATNYTVVINLVITDNSNTILSRSAIGCNSSHYTIPVLDCRFILWPVPGHVSIVQFLRDTEMYKFIRITVDGDGRNNVQEYPGGTDTFDLYLDPGISYNITVIALGGGNMNSTPCFHVADNPPTDPDCTSIYNHATANSIPLSMKNIKSKGVAGYKILVTNFHLYEQITAGVSDDVTISNLTAGTEYTLRISAIGNNGIRNTSPCTLIQYTKPATPKCNEIVWTSTNNSITFDLKKLSTPDTVGHFIISRTTVRVPNSNATHTFGNLQPGSAYPYQIESIGPDDRNSLGYCFFYAYTRPNDPTCDQLFVVRMLPASIKIELDWLRIDGAVEYNVTRNPGGVSTVVKVGSPYMESNLTPGTLYTFTIYSVGNASMPSVNSCSLSTYTAPAKPGTLLSVVRRETGFGIAWGKSSGNVERYNVLPKCICRQDFDICKPYVEYNENLTEPIANISGLVPGTFCNFSIVAILDHLESESQTITYLETEEIPPGEITSLNVTVADVHSIDVTFHKPDEPNGIILYYILKYQYRNHSSEYCFDATDQGYIPVQENITISSSENMISKRFENVFPYWNYTFQVQAVNKAGSGQWCGREEVTTLPVGPGPVRFIEVTNITSTSISVSWTAPCFPNGIIDQYNVLIHSLPSSSTIMSVSDLNVTLTKLQPYMQYFVTVFGHTLSGADGPLTEYTGNITTLTDVPLPPKHVVAYAISSTSITVNWTHPAYITGPTTYLVSAMDVQTKQNVSFCKTDDFNQTSCVITNLDQYWNYTVIVSASTVNGSTSAEFAPMVQTAEDAPGKVQNLTVSVEQDVDKPRLVNISWEKPKRKDLNGVIRSYSLEYYTNPSEKVVKTMAANIINIDSLQVTAGQSYTFKVYAITIKKSSSFAAETVHIPMGAPPALSNLTVSKGSTSLVSNNDKQFSINLETDYLCNNSNGEPSYWGIIVSEDSQTGKTSPFRGEYSKYKDVQKTRYETWSQVHGMGKMKPYIASNTFNPNCSQLNYGGPKRANRSESSEVTFIVGSEGDCKSSKNICNGYVKPGKTYRVRVWSCTTGGCAESEYSVPLTTDISRHSKPNKMPVIAGAVSSGVIVIVIVIIVIIVTVWRKQRGKFKLVSRRNTGHSNAGYERFDREVEMENQFVSGYVLRFTQHVEAMQKDQNKGFSEEFQKLTSNQLQHSMTSGNETQNKDKNRSTDILASDHSRVKLPITDDELASDYINATYVPGFNGENGYIAAQSPLPNTKDDFWRMIWEQHVTAVIMLNQPTEDGEESCVQYWPENLNVPDKSAGNAIEKISESLSAQCSLQELEISMGQMKRHIKQFILTEWPDITAQGSTRRIFKFVNFVRSNLTASASDIGPILVHCGSGNGRTGIYIAVDRLMQAVNERVETDAYGVVLSLNNARKDIVESEEEYMFIHDCVYDYIKDRAIENDDDRNELT